MAGLVCGCDAGLREENVQRTWPTSPAPPRAFGPDLMHPTSSLSALDAYCVPKVAWLGVWHALRETEGA